jgi:toxic protein SymE
MDKTVKQAHLHGKYIPGRNPGSGGRELPWLNLSGIWLEHAGFTIGRKIEITVTEGQLTIKAV